MTTDQPLMRPKGVRDGLLQALHGFREVRRGTDWTNSRFFRVRVSDTVEYL